MGTFVQVGKIRNFCIFIDLIHNARFTYETDDFNHLDLIQELELDPEFFKAPPV